MKFVFLLFSLVVIINSCDQSGKYKNDLLSNDKAVICKACYELGELKDTSAVRLLLNQSMDPRVTHHHKFKGMSVYQCKMSALQKISGIKTNFDYRPDTTIINVYLNWAITKGIIQSELDVNVLYDN